MTQQQHAMNENQIAALDAFTAALLRLLSVAGPQMNELAARAISDGLNAGNVKFRIELSPSSLTCILTNGKDQAADVPLLDLTDVPLKLTVIPTGGRPN